MVRLFFIVSNYFFPLNIPVAEPFMGEERTGKERERRRRGAKRTKEDSIIEGHVQILVGRPCKATSSLLTMQLRQKKKTKECPVSVFKYHVED